MRIKASDLDKVKNPKNFTFKVFKIPPVDYRYDGDAYICGTNLNGANLALIQEKLEDEMRDNCECLYAYHFMRESDWTGDLSDEYFFTYGIEET